MQIAKTFTVPIDASVRDTKWIANNSNALSFSTLMQGVIDDKMIAVQETATQKQSNSSCDCDKSKAPCKCDSDEETEEATEAKKTGLAACMECPNRTNGQCAMWNDEDKDNTFNLLSITSNSNTVQTDIAKSLDLQTHLDAVAKASSNLDYTSAYAYLRRKPKSNIIE